jgi:Zn-dependent M28 family amino/carboxypeptidase
MKYIFSYLVNKNDLIIFNFFNTFLFIFNRTIRAVFWTAEEEGLLGAKSYYKAHKNGSDQFVFVSETDQGAFKPETYNSVLKFSGTAKQVIKGFLIKF